jgi:hypothetical protein
MAWNSARARESIAEMWNKAWFDLCLVAVLWTASSQGGEQLRSRGAFVDAINKVQEGMSEASALSLLGRPDEVVVERKRLVDFTSDATPLCEIWRYGVAGSPSFATLGEIKIGRNHEVVDVVGRGLPLPDGLFTEQQIRLLLDLLNHVPSHGEIARYDPRPVICAVNGLQRLGKEKALAAIDEFLRITDGPRRYGVFLVLRSLFDVPSVPGYMPGIDGDPDPQGPLNPKLLPRFPITLEGDIPFLLRVPMGRTGPSPRPDKHVAYFRKYGKLRSQPLSPTVRPYAALDEFTQSSRWYFKDRKRFTTAIEARIRKSLDEQVGRLLDSVYRFEDDPCRCDPSLVDRSKERERKPAEMSKARIRWDYRICKYTFLDGTRLREIRYARHSWKPAIPGLSSELTVQRANPSCVVIGLQQSWQRGSAIPSGIIKVYDVQAMESPLYEFQLGQSHLERLANEMPAVARALADTTNSHQVEGGSGGVSLCLKEGTEIQAKLELGKASQRSPVFKP